MSSGSPLSEVPESVNLDDPQRAEPRGYATLPFVTVLMPVRNEAAFLERSLGSVLLQDYPRTGLRSLSWTACPTIPLERSCAGFKPSIPT